MLTRLALATREPVSKGDKPGAVAHTFNPSMARACICAKKAALQFRLVKVTSIL